MPERLISATLALQPKVVEAYGTPEYYSDGAVFFPHNEVMTSVFFVERIVGFKIERHEVCRIHFSRTGWLAGLDRTNRVLRETIGAVH